MVDAKARNVASIGLDWIGKGKRKAEQLVEDIREGPSKRGDSGVREIFDSSAIIAVTS